MKPASSPETEPDFYAMEPCADKYPDHGNRMPAPQVIPSSPVRSSSSHADRKQEDDDDDEQEAEEEIEVAEQQEESTSFIMESSLALMETDPPIPMFQLNKTPCMSREPSFTAKALSVETDPPIPVFSITKAKGMSREPSFLVGVASAVVSLPSTPLAADMRTISFDPYDGWSDTIFFSNVPSVSDLFHEWTEDRATTSSDGNLFAMDCDSEGEAVGLEMNL
jgi:hypothetical protein